MKKRTSPKQIHSSEDVAHAVSLFFAVRRIMRTKLAQGKKLDPSTWLRIETMQFIASHDEPKMKDIADYLSITAPSTTSLVRGLMKSRLVMTHIDRQDRRTSRLMLTREGKTELKKATLRGIQILSELFTTLSRKELIAFTGALERMRGTVAKASHK